MHDQVEVVEVARAAPQTADDIAQHVGGVGERAARTRRQVVWRVTPLSQLRSTWPVLKSPANRHKAVGFTYEQWRYVFTNTFDEADTRAAYDRYHIPASGGIFWDSVLANFIPARRVSPTLARPFSSSRGAKMLMPPAVQRSNAKHYKSNTVTEVKEFSGRSHLMPAQNGWEEVADYALAWAMEHATGGRSVIRGRQTGDSGADYKHVRLEVAGQRKGIDGGQVHP